MSPAMTAILHVSVVLAEPPMIASDAEAASMSLPGTSARSVPQEPENSLMLELYPRVVVQVTTNATSDVMQIAGTAMGLEQMNAPVASPDSIFQEQAPARNVLHSPASHKTL